VKHVGASVDTGRVRRMSRSMAAASVMQRVPGLMG
jgi:hypothetical protein